jgi:hypothetical protein
LNRKEVMRRVFIFGAGASAFAGYPLAPNLWRFLRDSGDEELGAKRRRDAVLKELGPILQRYSLDGDDQLDLEKLFTLLDLAHLGTTKLDLRVSDWPLTKRQIMGMIAESFQWHQYKFQAEVVDGRLAQTLRGPEPFGLGLGRESVLSTTEKLVGMLKPCDTIITFNWDILPESLLWRDKKWHFADGYGFQVRDAPLEEHSPIKILKLHGSVNWAQRSEDDCEPEIEHKGTFFPGAVDDSDTFRRAIGSWNDGRYLIVPSYLKDLSANRLLLRLWEQARDTLLEADKITVIGFSLNEADAPARHLLGSALDRNRNLRELLVVAPEQYEWDRFCYRFGKQQRSIYKKFEDWLKRPPD